MYEHWRSSFSSWVDYDSPQTHRTKASCALILRAYCKPVAFIGLNICVALQRGRGTNLPCTGWISWLHQCCGATSLTSHSHLAAIATADIHGNRAGYHGDGGGLNLKTNQHAVIVLIKWFLYHFTIFIPFCTNSIDSISCIIIKCVT